MQFSSLFGIFCVVAVSCVVHVITVESTNVLQSYNLVGKERLLPYERFQGLPESICTNLTTLRLEYLEFDPNQLVQSLEGCLKLKSINLDNVEFLNPVTRKVRLFGLERFHLTMYHIEANTAEEFLDHLFFFNNSDGVKIPETVKNIDLYSPGGDGMFLSYASGYQRLLVINMKYDITKYFNYCTLIIRNSFVDHKSIKVNNLKSLELTTADYEAEGLFETLKLADHLTELTIQKGKVNLPHPSIDLSIFPSINFFTHLVIEDAKVWSSKLIHFRKLKYLYLTNCEFNTILISGSVNELKFEQVRFIDNDMNTFLSSMNNLRQIELNYTGIPGQIIDLTSLGNSSGVLHEMKFTGMQIQITSRHFQFFNVDSLDFIECSFDFDKNPYDWFKSTFPNLSNVVLHRNNLSYSMLQYILNSSVTFVDFKPRKFEIPEITKFLKDSGVLSGSLKIQLVRSGSGTTGWWNTDFDTDNYYEYYPPNMTFTNTVLYVYILLLMCVCGFGLIGSLISSIVLTRKNLWGSTSCILLGLTFCDSLVLLTYICSVLYFGIKLILVFLEVSVSTAQVYRILGFEINQFSIKSLDEFQYSVLYPLNKTGYTGSVYATVLLTIERYVAVCWPLHARRWLRTRVAVTSIFIVLCFSMLLNSPRWIEGQQSDSFIEFGSGLFDPNRLYFYRKTHAFGLLQYRYYREYYHGWIWVTFMYLIPISGLTILNFLILKQLRKSNQNRKALSTSNQRNGVVQEEAQLASLTKMLLTVIMIFIICNSVSGVIVWVFIVRSWDPMDIEIFSCIPLIINSSINFIIYVLLGTKFRTELRNLISKWRNVICSCWNWSRRSDAENNARPTPLVVLPSRPEQV